MTSRDATPRNDGAGSAAIERRSPGPDRRRPAVTLIERAGFTPDAGPLASVPRQNPLIALVHDGGDRAILGAVETGMAEALAGGELLLAIHTISTGDAAPSQLADLLQRHRPKGVVLAPPMAGHGELLRLCAEARVRCLALGATRSGAASSNFVIAVDERRVARDLVGWLIVQGHARIGFVAGPDGSPSAQQRELGYLDAMADSGLDRGPALIVPGDNSFASGIEAGRLLLEISPRPTAICASNDAMAAGVLHAAAQIGLPVPSELSVTGIDDAPPLAAQMLPPLTTMHIPWTLMGREAAHRTALRGNAGVPAGRDFAARLVVRGSVQPLT